MSVEDQLRVGMNHLGRFAFYTRDNPYVSSLAGLELSEQHESTLVSLLNGTISVDSWLSCPEAQSLLDAIEVGCLPRHVQTVITGGAPSVGVESVHGFVRAPLFWWLVSILWCMSVGRLVDKELDENVKGYRLHSDFLNDPNTGGRVFRDTHRSYRSWSDFPDTVDSPHGETLAATKIDIKDFYYSVSALPSAIVSRVLESDAQAPTDANVLTKLLDALHRRYGAQCATIKPRHFDHLSRGATFPLPVGLPSSQILANAVMHASLENIRSSASVQTLATYADDIFLVSSILPKLKETAWEYLARIGVARSTEDDRLAIGDIAPLAVLEIRMEKSETSYARRAQGPVADRVQHLGDTDPYFDSHPDPDWGGQLRTVLRSPHRRDRVPREIVKTIRALISELRVGTDTKDAERKFDDLFSSLDAASFLAVRSFWVELLVAGIVSRPTTSIQLLDGLFRASRASTSAPEGSTAALDSALDAGLSAAWNQALAQAISITALKPADLVGVELHDVVWQQARSIREHRLIPGNMVAVPLAEFSEWTGPLIGPGAFEAFLEWSRAHGSLCSLTAVRARMKQSVRFLSLHETCLALHLWIGSREDPGWLDSVFALLGSQPLIRGEQLSDLHEACRNAISVEQHQSSKTSTEAPIAERPAVPLKIAMASVDIRSDQLALLLDPNAAAESANAQWARKSLSHVVWAANKRDADVLVLPEWAIRPETLPWLMSMSAHGEMLIVGGQAPAIRQGFYSNLLWTGIPVSDKHGHRACLVPPPREKAPLSPAEQTSIHSCGISRKIPDSSVQVFRWGHVRFASLICFEFSDIDLRAQLQGRIDLLTVSSVNRDHHYFESVQGSVTRDIYCITICVNSGLYRGTRVMRPTKEIHDTVAAIHGSEDPVVVTRTIDMGPIIEAQLTGTDPEESGRAEPIDGLSLADYKPLPPGLRRE